MIIIPNNTWMNIKVAANNRFNFGRLIDHKPCYFFQQVIIWHEHHKRLAALVYIVQCKHLILICSNCYTAGKKTIQFSVCTEKLWGSVITILLKWWLCLINMLEVSNNEVRVHISPTFGSLWCQEEQISFTWSFWACSSSHL